MCRVNKTPEEMNAELRSVYKSLGFVDEMSKDEEESLMLATAFAFTNKCDDILKEVKREYNYTKPVKLTRQ